MFDHCYQNVAKCFPFFANLCNTLQPEEKAITDRNQGILRVSNVICARSLTDRATASGAVGVGSIPAGRAFLGVEFGKSATSSDFQKVLLGKSGRAMRSIGLRRYKCRNRFIKFSFCHNNILWLSTERPQDGEN